MTESKIRVVVFTCNWNAHESLLGAARQRLPLPAGARPLKVDCLGQVSPSLILKAFEKGAHGVMLVGCSPDECYYEFGSRRAAELFEQVRELARLLGIDQQRLQFHQIHTGQGAALVEKVRDFVTSLERASSSPAEPPQVRPVDVDGETERR